MANCSASSVEGKSQNDKSVAVPGTSSSTSAIISRRDLLDGKFFEYLPQESTATTVTALCQMCLPTSIKVKGPDESSLSFIGHLKRKHGEHTVNQYIKYIKRKKENVENSNMMCKNSEVSKISEEQIKQKIVLFIINSMIPLEYIDNSFFFNFLENLNMPKNHLDSICNEKFERYLDDEFVRQMNIIKSKVIKANFVCTSCEVWQRQDKQYLIVTAHWFTEDLYRVSVALSCKEYKGVPPYYDLNQFVDPIFDEFSLCSDEDRVSKVFIEDCRVFIRGFKSYGVENESIDCKDPSSILDILSQPTNTETTGNLLVWMKEEFDDDYYSLPDIIDCSGRTLRLTATADFIKILHSSPDYLYDIHGAALQKCNCLWRAAGNKVTANIIQTILGHNLIRPEENRWISLYDAFRQILSIKQKNRELHDALGYQHSITDQEFIYIEEHLRSAMPVAEAVDMLMNRENNFYGILLPCLTALIKKLKEIEDQNDMVYCNYLVSGFRKSIEERFHIVLSINNVEAEHAAIAAISCPRFKNKWFIGTEYQNRCGIIGVFEALITRETNTGIDEDKTPNNNLEQDLFGYNLEKSEAACLSSPAVPEGLSKAVLEMIQYFDDNSEDLESLDRYPAVKKVFMQYNAPLASPVLVNKIFNSEEAMRLKKTSEIEQEALFKRVIMKYNLESMKYFQDCTS